ncbi:chromate efflux transporter [Pseudoalteromonas sp. KAN5]|uniref:chromate efflux transporter n=1 Tax=Pseudoalteromonas sp. KAN5 TaxID=2916633 RepID=UPI001FCAF234|nr:chromate efflux transporter [Pseudoalteromonas sp. KAN5]BDF96242.1 chorismate-binding protein [Pseudoalteromonas sp. KAN5]
MLLAIFKQFFLLGCMSFGGPAAHLGYFKRHFVDNLKWLTTQRYAQLISLSQALPGPGSSQVGFAIGVERGGLLGGIAAFIGFTLPSLLIMILLAISTHQFDAIYFAIIAGLKLFAVVIVADATLSMAKSFCTNWILKILAVASTILLILIPNLTSQIAVLVIAASVGAIWPMLNLNNDESKTTTKAGINWFALLLFALLLALSFIPLNESIALFAPFYQAGAMVFGGGHVVLPILQAGLPTLSTEQFLTAYASAQAVPGPMFTIASYLGAQFEGIQPVVGALIATILIFLPGLLLMFALQNSWLQLAKRPRFASSIAALNAAVVGFLAAALYSPIWTSAIHSIWHSVIVAAAFAWLRLAKPPIWWLLIAFISMGLLQYYLPL